MATAIQIENISKLYRLGEVGTGTISHDLNRWWHKIRGKEDPFMKIGQVNDRTQKGDGNYVWSLKDINLTIEQGDIVGIIGRNGAGKSTLLKILSGITVPTTGEIKLRGRMASLLEVGTGFHPEMTGLENIYMNGTIMGMTRYEINSRLEEIVEFAGVSMYLDTPVKRYSSGMMVRLGFAIAAHLEPEILIVDEVLAVGDTEFQKKAVGKMQEVSSGGGKTVLFVSHNIPTIKSICQKGVVLDKGLLAFNGGIDDAVGLYTARKVQSGTIKQHIHYLQKFILVHNVTVNGVDDCNLQVDTKMLHIHVDIEFFSDLNYELDVHIAKDDLPVASYSNFVFNAAKSFKKGRYQFDYKIELNQFRSGTYKLDLFFTDPYTSWYAVSRGEINLEIVNVDHDVLLNNPALRWGGVLLNGDLDFSMKS